MLEITQSDREGWCVVAAKGRADANTSGDLETALVGAAEKYERVALDFSALDYISSAGLRAVLQGARAAQTRNAQFTVCALTPPVKKVFDMSGMDRILRIEGALPC